MVYYHITRHLLSFLAFTDVSPQQLFVGTDCGTKPTPALHSIRISQTNYLIKTTSIHCTGPVCRCFDPHSSILICSSKNNCIVDWLLQKCTISGRKNQGKQIWSWKDWLNKEFLTWLPFPPFTVQKYRVETQPIGLQHQGEREQNSENKTKLNQDHSGKFILISKTVFSDYTQIALAGTLNCLVHSRENSKYKYG